MFQTAGAACEKARSAKARLVRSSCSRFLPQDRSWREAERHDISISSLGYDMNPSDGSQAQGLQTAGCDVAVCGSVHLRTHIRRIFRIHKLSVGAVRAPSRDSYRRCALFVECTACWLYTSCCCEFGVRCALVYDIVRYLGAAIIAGLPHPRSIPRYRLIDKNPTNNLTDDCHHVWSMVLA